VGDQPPLRDDDNIVGERLNLGEQVARDQDGAALIGEAAQEVAQPADALGVEAVGGLVEDEDAGVADQRSRDAQPLTHPERVALDRATAGRGESHQGKDLVGPLKRNAAGPADDAQVVAPRAARCAALPSSTAPTWRIGRFNSS
jgi:hypothetical protein